MIKFLPLSLILLLCFTLNGANVPAEVPLSTLLWWDKP